MANTRPQRVHLTSHKSIRTHGGPKTRSVQEIARRLNVHLAGEGQKGDTAYIEINERARKRQAALSRRW